MLQWILQASPLQHRNHLCLSGRNCVIQQKESQEISLRLGRLGRKRNRSYENLLKMKILSFPVLLPHKLPAYYRQVVLQENNHPLMCMEKFLKKSLQKLEGVVFLAVTIIPSPLKYCPIILHISEPKMQKENVPQSLQDRLSACDKRSKGSTLPFLLQRLLTQGQEPDIFTVPNSPTLTEFANPWSTLLQLSRVKLFFFLKSQLNLFRENAPLSSVGNLFQCCFTTVITKF